MAMMESLILLFDRSRTRASSVLLFPCCGSGRGKYNIFGQEAQQLWQCAVSFGVTLCKQVVSQTPSSTSQLPWMGARGCEGDVSVMKFCQTHRACCCLILPLSYEGFRRSSEMWKKWESQQWQKLCSLLVSLLTENVNFSVRIFWLAAKMLELPALPGLPGIACCCSPQYALVPHQLCQPSFFSREGRWSVTGIFGLGLSWEM